MLPMAIKIDEYALNIYTDGSMLPSPRRGGIGIVFITVDDNGKEVRDPLELPGYAGSNSAEMELWAVVSALEDTVRFDRVSGYDRVIVYTDSQYVRDGYTNARYVWPKTKWTTKAGTPVENIPLWKKLIKLSESIPAQVKIEWVKGHAKNEGNKQAHKIADLSAKAASNDPLQPAVVRRKITDRQVEPGCVPMQGQEIDIRIITGTYIRSPHRVNKYRYEVLSEGEHHGKVDFIYWKENLREGHHFRVRVNEDQHYPQVVECIVELER